MTFLSREIGRTDFTKFLQARFSNNFSGVGFYISNDCRTAVGFFSLSPCKNPTICKQFQFPWPIWLHGCPNFCIKSGRGGWVTSSFPLSFYLMTFCLSSFMAQNLPQTFQKLTFLRASGYLCSSRCCWSLKHDSFPICPEVGMKGHNVVSSSWKRAGASVVPLFVLSFSRSFIFPQKRL